MLSVILSLFPSLRAEAKTRNGFNTEFPSGCMFYNGLHDADCLTTIWLEVGCRRDGFNFPLNMSHLHNQLVESIDLR